MLVLVNTRNDENEYVLDTHNMNPCMENFALGCSLLLQDASKTAKSKTVTILVNPTTSNEELKKALSEYDTVFAVRDTVWISNFSSRSYDTGMDVVLPFMRFTCPGYYLVVLGKSRTTYNNGSNVIAKVEWYASRLRRSKGRYGCVGCCTYVQLMDKL